MVPAFAEESEPSDHCDDDVCHTPSFGICVVRLLQSPEGITLQPSVPMSHNMTFMATHACTLSQYTSVVNFARSVCECRPEAWRYAEPLKDSPGALLYGHAYVIC